MCVGIVGTESPADDRPHGRSLTVAPGDGGFVPGLVHDVGIAAVLWRTVAKEGCGCGLLRGRRPVPIDDCVYAVGDGSVEHGLRPAQPRSGVLGQDGNSEEMAQSKSLGQVAKPPDAV